ncbi:CLC2E protein, partial [Menura novaehollandiae]|nr:CLC2E protein [Menura novaehollandiae]
DFGLKCIKDKKIPIGATVVVAGLLLAVIALAGEGWGSSPKAPSRGIPAGNNSSCSSPAKKCPPCPSCPDPAPLQCLENGIGFGEKCFYFLEEEKDWDGGRNSCLSRRAHLATVDTWEELNFLLRYGSSLHFWLGLRRENSRPWEWYNGSLYNA